jgi:hypothetical protein
MKRDFFREQFVTLSTNVLLDAAAEIERLRLEARQASAAWGEDKRADEAEIERLRSRLSWFETAGGVAVTTKVHEQQAEIERLRALLAEGFGHIESFRQLLRDGLQRLPTRFAGPCNCTLRCGLVSWQTKAYEMIDDPTKYEDLGHCHQCGEPILLNDDAEVCIQCGGRNVRYSLLMVTTGKPPDIISDEAAEDAMKGRK